VLDDIDEMFDKVMPGAGCWFVSTHETRESSPPEHDHHPRYRHGRPENLHNNQDSLLPRSDSTQVDGPQTCPGGCTDAEEEGVDVSNAKCSTGSPEDDGPEERDYDAEIQETGGKG